jgi:putative endonuclease
MMASRQNGTIYTGSTDDLHKRYLEHHEGHGSEFTTKYRVGSLVWFEIHDTRRGAFLRERRIKEWRRSWKVMAIEEFNLDWLDLGERFDRMSPAEVLLQLTGGLKIYSLSDLDPDIDL